MRGAERTAVGERGAFDLPRYPGNHGDFKQFFGMSGGRMVGSRAASIDFARAGRAHYQHGDAINAKTRPLRPTIIERSRREPRLRTLRAIGD